MGLFEKFRGVEERAVSINDPAFLDFFGIGAPNYSGVTVTETTSLTVAAVWRAVSLISQTIASLDTKVTRLNNDGTTDVVPTFLDNPAASDGGTRFEFWETVMVHLLLHGNAFLLHVYNRGGALVGLYPIHPSAVSVDRVGTGAKVFTVSTLDGTPGGTYTEGELLHIPAMSTDGIVGMSVIHQARNSFGTAVAGERAASKSFSTGAMISGLVTPRDGVDLSKEDARTIHNKIRRNVTGWENAGGIAVVNRQLEFTPWSISNKDAQFLESRQFQIEEIARWFGIPPFELMQTEKQTSWGTGIEAQQRGLSRQVLGPWTRRIDARLSALLPDDLVHRFDFDVLERPTPEEEVKSLIEQVNAGLLTINEARAIRGLPPLADTMEQTDD